jgi:hypothetical protein
MNSPTSGDRGRARTLIFFAVIGSGLSAGDRVVVESGLLPKDLPNPLAVNDGVGRPDPRMYSDLGYPQ